MSSEPLLTRAHIGRSATIGMWLTLALVTVVAGEQHAPLPARSVSIDPNTVLVLFGTRHGNRQPEKFLEENPRTWGFEGSTELSSFGKRQGFGLGKELRSFVGKKIDENYNRTQVKYYSSSASRCQMTLQTALAAFHEPEGWGDWNTAKHEYWSPVPYSIDDHLLRMYAVEDCPNSDKAWKPISDDQLPELAKKKKESVVLRDYCQKQTGWNMSNLGTMADLADNLIEIDLYKAPYPAWISNPTLPGYNSERLKKEILEFAEIHQNACAEYGPCGDLMGGYWLKNILDNIKDKSEGKGPAMVGYASHTEVTLSVMRLMGIDKDELTTSAGFVIEYRNKPYPSVRLLNHDPNPIDPHVIYRAKYVDKLQRLAEQNGFIPLAAFKSHVQPKVISDWKKACGTEETCGTSRAQRQSSSATTIFSAIVALVTAMNF